MTPSPELKQAVDAFQSGDLDRALSIAEREVLSGASPQWHHLLGLIHCRLGDPSRGVEHLRSAADSEPANAAFQVMLIRALVDSGRAAEALALPEPPPIESPAGAALWQARAEAADSAGDVNAAAEAWAKVAAATPRDWRAWVNLGNAHASQRRWEEAGEALAKAAELNPADLSIRRSAGSALVEADRMPEALEQFQALVGADPDNAEGRTLLAQALAALHRHEEAVAEFEAARRLGGETVATELGLGRRYLAELRYAEAEAAFRRAYALDPANRTIVRHLGLALERTNQLGALSKLLNEAQDGGIGKGRLSYLWAVRARREGRLDEARELLLQSDPNEDPIGWNWLRAKIADEMDETAEAFDAALAMNQAAQKAASKAFDLDVYQREGEAYRQGQHRLARTITPEWAARVPILAVPPQQRVAFLVGFPRSGTTLLDTFLMGHPQVDVLEEKQLALVAGEALGPIEHLPNTSIEALGKARGRYFDLLAEHVSPDFDGIVIDKFPLYMGSAPLLQAMFPGAPFIFAQRHPCDVVLSAFMQSFGLMNFSDIHDAADYYDALMSIWTASREAMNLNVYTVVYEDLVSDPESSLKPVLGFLGLDWNGRLLDHRKTALERGTIITPSYDQVTQPVTTRPSGRWKQYREQLAPVLPLLLPWAERLGYAD